MKCLGLSVVLVVFLYVIIAVPIEMWHICWPLSLVMILRMIGSILTEITRNIFKEKKSVMQSFVSYIVWIPMHGVIVYLLWPEKLELAIAYGLFVLIGLFLQVSDVRKEYSFK